MPRHELGRYAFIEPPDASYTVDFADLCAVELSSESGEPNRICVVVKGKDDRVSILLDTELDIPEFDDRE